MSLINVLPEHIANKIAAGEVVERPASVVKELIENSLDAGATQIEVEFKDGGRSRIVIRDNGKGMSHEDASLAFQRHATSKIKDLEDIYSIGTLGFRGEALPSIASIAHVELLTSEKKAASGTRLKIEAGKQTAYEAAPPEEGTRISIGNLFFNTPARRKFLKTDKTEAKQIVSTVMLAALVHKGVGFRLKEEERVIFDVPKQSDLKERVGLLLGKAFKQEMISIASPKGEVQVSGMIGKPTLNRGNRLSQFFFVNGRPIQNRNLSFALFRGFDALLMTKRYPVGVIFIEIEPSLVDVNIHPTKKEVRFHDESKVISILVRAIKDALAQTDFIPTLKDKFVPQSTPVAKPTHEWKEDSLPLKGASLSSHLKESITEYQERENEKKLIQAVEKVVEEKASEGDPVPSDKQQVLKVLGVVRQTYIICETTTGFLMIDQHAAHERLLFEQVMLDFQKGNVEVQQLLLPEMVELTAIESALIESELEFLNKVGLSISLFGQNSYVVDAVPTYFKNNSIGKLIHEMVNELDQSGKVQSHEKKREKIAAMMSCKAAVKAGDVLKQLEMERLATQAYLNLQNKTCPHGRPVMFQLSDDDLAKQFKRK